MGPRRAVLPLPDEVDARARSVGTRHRRHRSLGRLSAHHGLGTASGRRVDQRAGRFGDMDVHPGAVAARGHEQLAGHARAPLGGVGAEHAQLGVAAEGAVVVEVEDVRQRLAWLLTALRHQRARESDLIYEAYYDAFETELTLDRDPNR